MARYDSTLTVDLVCPEAIECGVCASAVSSGRRNVQELLAARDAVCFTFAVQIRWHVGG